MSPYLRFPLPVALLVTSACSAASTGSAGSPRTSDETAEPSAGDPTGGSGGNGIVVKGRDGGGTPTGASCLSIHQKAKPAQSVPVDIVWAVDTSGSSASDRESVKSALNSFAQQVVSAGIDVHVVVLGDSSIYCVPPPLGSGNCGGGTLNVDDRLNQRLADTSNDTQLPKFLHLDAYVASWMPLGTFRLQYEAYKKVLRKNAIKEFVVTEDGQPALGLSMDPSFNRWDMKQYEDDASTFTSELAALSPPISPSDFVVHGIYCNGAGGVTCQACVQTFPTGTYADLIAGARDGKAKGSTGLAVNLCSPNAYQDLFDRLSAHVIKAAKISCAWDIPEQSTFDKGQVNVQFTSGKGAQTDYGKVRDAAACSQHQGWYYDDPNQPKRLLVCPTTCNAIQSDSKGSLDVLFGCPTVDVH